MALWLMALTQAITVKDQDNVLGTATQKVSHDKSIMRLDRACDQQAARQRTEWAPEQVSSDCPGCYTLLVVTGLVLQSFIIHPFNASLSAHFSFYGQASVLFSSHISK